MKQGAMAVILILVIGFASICSLVFSRAMNDPRPERDTIVCREAQTAWMRMHPTIIESFDMDSTLKGTIQDRNFKAERAVFDILTTAESLRSLCK